MSNKTQLQTNNTALDGYIARINAAKEIAASLPEVGSGGGNIETCKVNVISNGVGGNIFSNRVFCTFYTNGKLESVNFYYSPNNITTISSYVVKGSIMAFENATNLVSITCDSGSVLYCTTGHGAVFINQDAPDEVTITLNNQ
ncbi:MAG: hypothetical protein UH850_11230 [Paludibacteraceae bacterium]|nr:hypothetical protein [Paludibacteraceae bacterium]